MNGLFAPMTQTASGRSLRAAFLLGGALLGGIGPAAAGPVEKAATRDAALQAQPGAVASGGTAASGDPLDPVGDLAAAERLTLRFRGYPELTGDYRVSLNRTISVPVIGRVSVAGLDLGALEKALSLKLLQITQKEAFVTAEVAAYRPVFITGSVRNPGGVEWRPNMTVLQAVSLAGGMASEVVPGAAAGTAAANPLVLQKAVDNRKRDLAAIARLRAERDDAPGIAVPQDLVGLVGQAEAKQLIAREAEVLTRDRATVAAKLDTLQQGIEAGGAEQDSLREQIEKLKGQLRMRVEYQGKVRDLFAKGYVTAERNLEAEIKINDLEEKITNIKVGLAKSAGTVAELKLQAVALRRDRQKAVADELARLERASAQLALEIGASQQSSQQLLQPASEGEGDEKPWSALQIVRQENGGSVTMTVDPGTLMRPGDVLVVGRA